MAFGAYLPVRASQVLRVFLVAALIVAVYTGLKHWGVLERNVWNIPGFLMLAGSMPWSLSWLDVPLETRNLIPPGIRNAFDLAAMSLGFGLNCALVYLVGATIWRRVRLTAQPTRTRA